MRGYVATTLGQIHYVRSGSGKPLVLLGSSGRSSRMFAGLHKELKDFTVIAFDVPGFGQSDDLAADVTLEQLADAFVETLDALSLPTIALFGLHTGNKIATAMAVRHPARIRCFILAGQTHSLIPDQERRNAGIRQMIAAYVDLAAVTAATSQKAAKVASLFAVARDGKHPELGGNILDHVLDELEARGTPTLYRANLAYDLEGGCRAIQVPTQVLEIATPAETASIGLQGQAMAALVPGASLVTLHRPDRRDPLTLEDCPDEIADIIARFAA